MRRGVVAALGFWIVAWAILFFALSARAAYPDGNNKRPGFWYLCSAYSSAAASGYSSPDCVNLPFDSDGHSAVFSGGDFTSGAPLHSQYGRWYVVPPTQTTGFVLTCGVVLNTGDEGTGAPNAGFTADGTSSTYFPVLRSAVIPNLTVAGNMNYSTRYTMTHAAIGAHTGHDAGHISHDPFLTWQVSDDDLPVGWYLQGHVVTNGATISAQYDFACRVELWFGSHAQTPTPAPTYTTFPTWTPTPSTTPTIVDPTSTSVMATWVYTPWATITPWIATPEPAVVQVNDPTLTPDCYRIVPDFNYDLGAFGYTQTVGVDPVDLCLNEQEFEVKIFDWDFGQMFWYAMAASAAAVVLSFFRG